MGRQAAGLLPELAEHLSTESGWMVATGMFSGVGESTGTFSLAQWRRDLETIVEKLIQSDRRVSLAGFGLGGALALDLASQNELIRGVATFATPSDLVQWCGDAFELHRLVVEAGVVDPAVAVLDPIELVAELTTLDPLKSAESIPPRRFLIGHGSEDRDVPVSAARALLHAADGRAELRIIQGAGHWLRADPRMVATLLGWLDRHR